MTTIRTFHLPSIFILLLAGVISGCASRRAEPQQIATYPQSAGGDWYLPAPPAGGRLVYDAYIALDVRHPEGASADAVRIARDYGGYLVNSHTSFTDGGESITLELRIPPHNFEAARRSFRSLGTLVRETVTGEWEGGRPGWEEYAQFTLFFRRLPAALPLPPVTGWDPVETFQRALMISARLVGFTLDLLIWVVVLLGPFALLGWGAAWIIRRGRGRPASPTPPPGSPLTTNHLENIHKKENDAGE